MTNQLPNETFPKPIPDDETEDLPVRDKNDLDDDEDLPTDVVPGSDADLDPGLKEDDLEDEEGGIEPEPVAPEPL